MPNSLSVLKRVRKSQKSRMKNREMKSKVKNARKNLRMLFEKGDGKTNEKKNEKAKEEISQEDLEKIWVGVRRYVSLLDKMVKKKLYHKNTAGRRKSQCMKQYHLLKLKSIGNGEGSEQESVK